uniref:Uncharacterized protein n=1 Tax=Arundo donax TaxID=35708 RepID=A0A0A9A0S5_ARUDO
MIGFGKMILFHHTLHLKFSTSSFLYQRNRVKATLCS